MRQTMNEIREAEQRALAIGEQIAVLLTQLEEVAPGSVSAHAGRISAIGVEIRAIDGEWTAEASR